MNHRRNFFRSVAVLAAQAGAAPQPATGDDRQYWLRILAKLAEPVLRNLAAQARACVNRGVRERHAPQV